MIDREKLVTAFDDALFYNAPDGASVFRWVDGRFTPSDEPMLSGLAERMADVALGVLRGGGADGGGEDQVVEHKPLDEFSDPQLIPTMWYSPSRATLRGSRTDGLIVERGNGTGRLYGYSAAAPGWRPFSSRMLLPDDAILLVGHGDYVAIHDIRRLATAAGVSPDSEDPVGAIEAAIRAGREQVAAGDEQIVAQYIDPEYLPNWQGMVADLRAGREPEVVTGAEAAELPPDTRVVRCDPEFGIPHIGYTVREVGRENFGVADGSYLVLYRAPAPAPAPLTVGDELRNVDDLRRAGVGAWVEYAPTPRDGRRQRALITSDGIFDGEVRAVCSEFGEALTFDKLVDTVWPMRLCGLPDGSDSDA